MASDLPSSMHVADTPREVNSPIVAETTMMTAARVDTSPVLALWVESFLLISELLSGLFDSRMRVRAP